MKIIAPSLKVPHLPQALSTDTNPYWSSYQVESRLQRNPVSKEWDTDKVEMEFKRTGELVFHYEGKEYDSIFLSDTNPFYGLFCLSHQTYGFLNIWFKLDKGIVKSTAVNPSDSWCQDHANMSPFITAYDKFRSQ